MIVGNVVVMKEGYREGEPDIVGLSEDEIDVVLARIIQMGKDAGADLMLQDLGLPARGLRITEKRDTEFPPPRFPSEPVPSLPRRCGAGAACRPHLPQAG